MNVGNPRRGHSGLRRLRIEDLSAVGEEDLRLVAGRLTITIYGHSDQRRQPARLTTTHSRGVRPGRELPRRKALADV